MDDLKNLANICTPMPPYFIIKIGKESQKTKKEKEGMLYFPTEYAYMRRELQFGEIISIGEGAAEYMPMAEIGDYLLIHYLISGKKTDKGRPFYFLTEDDSFNYYAVNAYEVPGEKPLAYAVAKGEEIVPTPDYIFLNVEQDNTESIVSENGIITQAPKEKTRQQWADIMKQNMARIQQLARNIPHGVMEEVMVLHDPERRERTEYAISEIKKLEAINTKISNDINKKKYKPFKVAAINPDWKDYIQETFGDEIKAGDIIYMLNMACNTTVDFSGTEFIVAETKYFGCSYNYLKKSVTNFKDHSATTSYNYSKRKKVTN